MENRVNLSVYIGVPKALFEITKSIWRTSKTWENIIFKHHWRSSEIADQNPSPPIKLRSRSKYTEDFSNEHSYVSSVFSSYIHLIFCMQSTRKNLNSVFESQAASSFSQSSIGTSSLFSDDHSLLTESASEVISEMPPISSIF